MFYPDEARRLRPRQPPPGRFGNFYTTDMIERGGGVIPRSNSAGFSGGSGAFATVRPRRFTQGSASDNGSSGVMAEMERMRRQMMSMSEQLALAEDTILRLKKREKELADKVTGDLQQGVTMGGRFENLSQGIQRPTQVIDQYGNLYTQGRIDAMDDLDKIAGLSKYGKHQEMKQKILYGIMVASYKVAFEYLGKVKVNVRRQLGIPESHTPNEKDAFGEALTFITTYLQSTTQIWNIEQIVADVQEQLMQLLPEFPSLSKLPGIAVYTAACCRLAWTMVNQIPPMELEHTSEKFSPVMHTRFHASSEKNLKVKMYVWPTLVDSSNKNILYRGVVWT